MKKMPAGFSPKVSFMILARVIDTVLMSPSPKKTAGLLRNVAYVCFNTEPTVSLDVGCCPFSIGGGVSL